MPNKKVTKDDIERLERAQREAEIAKDCADQELLEAQLQLIYQNTGIRQGVIVRTYRGNVYKVHAVVPCSFNTGQIGYLEGFKKTAKGWHKISTYVGHHQYIVLAANEREYEQLVSPQPVDQGGCRE